MADPVSVAGTAVGLISLGIQVTQALVNFYNSYKGQNSDLAHTTKRLDGLLQTLQSLQKTLSDRKFQADERSLVEGIEMSIKDCEEQIEGLQHEWQQLSKASSKGIMGDIKIAGRRVAYPLRQSTLLKLDENIDEIRVNLSFALEVLQLKDNKIVQDDITEIRTLLDLVRINQISSKLRDWLKVPDATIDHNAACAKKHPGTGVWLVKSEQFSQWLTEGNSILWLHGFAGSGKSVLCSTAIQFAFRHRRSDPNVGIAFFYFSFNDKSKQDESAMLRALLLQLSCQLKDGHADLTRLHDSHQAGVPPSLVLIDYLRRLVERFHDVYIVLDALDESPPNGPRKYVLDSLETMRNWGVQSLHIFVTSRDESDIHESLDLSATQQVKMRNIGIDKDIEDFISGRLDTDRRLRKLLPWREKIQESLAARAKGVFRWVDCQFEALQSCPRSEYHIDHMLSSLPESLDETYERMLCNINPVLIEDARRILTLLCYAPRPLSVQELIDAVAVEIKEPTGLNRRRRLQDSDGIREICGGLIDISLLDISLVYTARRAYHLIENHNGKEFARIVRIAHFSIQEYLESERIRHQKAAAFSLTSATAHAEIAQICLLYLLDETLSRTKLDMSILKEYPLALFAAESWHYHYQNTAIPHVPHDCILRLFQSQNSFANWAMLLEFRFDRSLHEIPRYDFSLDSIRTPVYYASLLGLDQTLQVLLSTEQVESTRTPSLLNTSTPKVPKLVKSDVRYSSRTLLPELFMGRGQIQQRLLDKGADVEARMETIDNALRVASNEGHGRVVQMLLENRADVNAQSGSFGSALHAASSGGHDQVVQMLLDKGADVNAQCGHHGNALNAASCGGHDQVIQMLLENGADVNAQSEEWGNALNAASFEGHDQVIQMLLENGADVNAQSEEWGNALNTASFGGHDQVVQMLLDKGADVNPRSEIFGSALDVASYEGHDQVVRMLLDKGANVNAQRGSFRSALHAASSRGHDQIVKMLLDKGADVNAQSGIHDNALKAASFGGHNQVVKMLLENGADVNNALNKASFRGHDQVVQMLLDKGADVNAQSGMFNNALSAASLGGHDQIVKMLLDKGADINVQDNYHHTALSIAQESGYDKVVQVLLDGGIEVKSKDLYELLRWALFNGHDKILQTLLDKVDNTKELDDLRQAASSDGNYRMLRLLRDHDPVSGRSIGH